MAPLFLFDKHAVSRGCQTLLCLSILILYQSKPMLTCHLHPAGDAFLVATGSSQIKVYDRDGKERGVSLAGDMYIRDLRNTKGHISPCTHAQWHPTDKYTGMTSSEDGSIRVWDTWNVLQKTVIKPQLAKPGRVAVTACAYNHDGGLIGGGMFDGTLQIWDVKGMHLHSYSLSEAAAHS